jgi:hypothetical protein
LDVAVESLSVFGRSGVWRDHASPFASEPRDTRIRQRSE